MKGGAPARRWGHSCCLAGDSQSTVGTMLLCGGIDAKGHSLSDCWLLHLEDMRWELVETLAAQSPVRSLPLASRLVPPPEEEQRQPELGRCTAAWSPSLGAVVVWCGQGFWTCRVPEAARAAQPLRQRGAPGEFACVDGAGEHWFHERTEHSPTRRRETTHAADLGRIAGGGYQSPTRRREAAHAVEPGRMAGGGYQSAPPALPDVLPPPRHARWTHAASCAHSLPRVQSEPRLHESWRPLPPPLMRGPGSQGNLLEPKSILHGQVLVDRPPLEATSQWHAKHGHSRLEALAPL